MRISDWSSDVCPSDLRIFRLSVRQRAVRRRFRWSAIVSPTLLCSTWPCRMSAGWIFFGRFMNMVCRSRRSEEHTSELQSLMRISYAVFCLKKKKKIHTHQQSTDSEHQENQKKTKKEQ